uniref:Uncharacterized protein n=1 Tax=viral metagenome TaxID=1070528 RepID=A0A6H2A0K7_9ZZZZ
MNTEYKIGDIYDVGLDGDTLKIVFAGDHIIVLESVKYGSSLSVSYKRDDFNSISKKEVKIK